jgi:hypothetical protein
MNFELGFAVAAKFLQSNYLDMKLFIRNGLGASRPGNGRFAADPKQLVLFRALKKAARAAVFVTRSYFLSHTLYSYFTKWDSFTAPTFQIFYLDGNE